LVWHSQGNWLGFRFRIFVRVCFGGGENVAYSLVPFPRVCLTNQDKHVFGLAEAFQCAIFPLPRYFNAVVHHAAQHASFAMQAQLLGYADAAIGPVKRVCGARFYAEFALDASAGVLVDFDGAFGVKVLVFVFGGLEEFLAQGFLRWFFVVFFHQTVSANGLRTLAGGHRGFSCWRVPFLGLLVYDFRELLLLIAMQEWKSPCKELKSAFPPKIGKAKASCANST
jgi:hypothetical protein